MRKLSFTSVWDLFSPVGGVTGYSTVSVRVQSVEDVGPVKKEIEALGFRTFALMDQFDQMRIGFLIMDMILIAVGMIGITVASLGIVNTMVMSILERYREIGIMKAVGATDGDVQRIFLFESGAIGLLGGSIGLGLGWAVSMIINEVDQHPHGPPRRPAHRLLQLPLVALPRRHHFLDLSQPTGRRVPHAPRRPCRSGRGFAP